MTSNLEKLADTAAGGDLTAASELVRHTHDHLFAFLHVRGIPSADIDDVAQGVTLQMLSSLGRYSPDRPFLPWFRAIARNASSSYWRTRKRKADRMSIFREYFTPELESREEEIDPYAHARQKLPECMERLEERHRKLATMRYFQRQDSSTIGEMLGIRPGTVRQMLTRIRAALRLCIEKAMAAEGEPA